MGSNDPALNSVAATAAHPVAHDGTVVQAEVIGRALTSYAQSRLAIAGLAAITFAGLGVVGSHTEIPDIVVLAGRIGCIAIVGGSVYSLARRMEAFVRSVAVMQGRSSRVLLSIVERFAHRPAGREGTVEALLDAAGSEGCELYEWDAASRTLRCVATGAEFPTPVAASRRLLAVLARRRPVSIADVSVSPVVPRSLGTRQACNAMVIAPMWSEDELLGIVVKRYASARAMLRANEAGIVAGLAAIGAVAVARARLLDLERSRAHDNQLLLESLQLADGQADRVHIARFAAQAAQALGSQRAIIWAHHAGRMLLVGSHGIDAAAERETRKLAQSSRIAQLARDSRGGPVGVRVAQLDDDTRTALQSLGCVGEVVVQPIGIGASSGVLVVDAVAAMLGNREVALLNALARQVDATIERRRMRSMIRRRSRHLARTPRLARALSGQRDPDAVARIAARELHDGFGFGRVSIALRQEDDSLAIVASAGMLARSSEPIITTTSLELAFREGRPYVACSGHGDDDRIDDANAPRGCHSHVAVPVIGEDHEAIGVIGIYERDPDALGEDDLHVIQTIADQLSGTLEQAQLYATLERNYFLTVEALAAALEAKDEYTISHARSITDLAERVGQRLGMREDELRDLRLGALLHDIGKIGVPTEILNKPGPLTLAEEQVMQQHTVIGEQIIAPVEFLQNVRPLVLHEHERWDGAGYPHGLSGEQIPLGARIILVCDAFHAMTSDRPYRQALDMEEARRRLVEGAGTQFDPDVVDAFIEVVDAEPQLLHY